MSQIYVVGGELHPDAAQRLEWQENSAAVIVRFDSDERRPEVAYRYVSPPEVCVDEKHSITFKAATLAGDRFYACTTTEAMVLSATDFETVAYITHPWFNDVHHAAPTPDGNIVVVSTGLDMAFEMTLDGEIVAEHPALPGDAWARFDRSADYRKVPSTKPHQSHPNFAFYLDDKLWLSRFKQRDAVRAGAFDERLPVDVQGLHDGIVLGGGERVAFTTVDGHIVVCDVPSCSRIAAHRLLDWTPLGGYSLGWCRGLAFLDDRRALVGFSRLRPTKWKENLKWVANRAGLVDEIGPSPTRVALYDLEAGAMLWELDLEPAGLGTVFSIHVVD